MASYYEWRYVVEEETGPDEWVSTSNHESKDEAIKVAKDNTRRSRVRAFKTTIISNGPSKSERAVVSETSTLVETVPFFCPTHPNEVANSFATSEPNCKLCRKPMFQGVPGDIT